MTKLEWQKKRKGTAVIYTHPKTDRAIDVVNFKGIHFNGERFETLEAAMAKGISEDRRS